MLRRILPIPIQCASFVARETVRRLSSSSSPLSSSLSSSSSKPIQASVPVSDSNDVLGQPRFETHPHLMNQGELTPGISSLEYEQRRKKLVNSLPESSLVILPGAGLQFRANDVPFPFRQQSDLSYFTGFHEPDAACVIEIPLQSIDGGDEKQYTMRMFCMKRDPSRELWNGPRTGVERLSLFGPTRKNSHPIDFLAPFLERHAKSFAHVFVPDDDPLIENLLTDARTKTEGSTSISKFSQRLRLIKSDAELELMRKASRASAKGFCASMAFQSHRPDGCVEERSLQAVMEMVSIVNGAYGSSYIPVVAGGSRACTLHYISNDRLIRQGEMVLMDAGCDVGGYTADISRTWPISGVYSDAQRELYEAVLRVQEKCLQLCAVESPANSLSKLHIASSRFMLEELLRLEILYPNDADKLHLVYPHAIGHYLGLDVHDTPAISIKEPFQENMVITVEPGLYIPPTSDYPERYRGIGIRIEDDVVIGRLKPEILTRDAPKQVSEIEKHISRYRKDPTIMDLSRCLRQF